MSRIDAHQHFWKFDPIRDAWITPDMSVLQQDFLPVDLEPLLQSVGIEGCVVVQADQSEEETEFLLEHAAKNPFIRGVVGWVDLRSPDLEERLVHYRRFPLLKGFRHILQGEKDRALMLNPAFKKGIGLLQQYGYTYDVLIFPDQLGYTHELAAAFPEQRFVLDHIAKPDIREKKLTAAWQEAIRDLGSRPNVYCKVSGMVSEADWEKWVPADFTPYLDTVVEAFGTKRLMYGSDWPVCLVAASYAEMWQIVQDYFSAFPTEEQDAFFGGNATEFYHL